MRQNASMDGERENVLELGTGRSASIAESGSRSAIAWCRDSGPIPGRSGRSCERYPNQDETLEGVKLERVGVYLVKARTIMLHD